MHATTKLVELPLLPRDEQGPVFEEPWQAQAFAVVVQLTESGALTRDEWAQRLGAVFREAEERGETDTGKKYYDHWLTALERLIIERQLAGSEELRREGEEIRANDHHRREHQLHSHD